MNETQLLRICLVVGIIGIIALFFIAESIEAIAVNIIDVTEEMIGKNVAVRGTVSGLKINDGITFFDLVDTDFQHSILVVFFEERIDIEEGSLVTIVGTVKEYKGQLEIVGERIEK